MSELAEHIAAAENATVIEALSSYERKRVYISLYQSHLPKMSDANVVDYDDNRKTVELRDGAKRLEPYLEDTDGSPARRAVTVAALATAVVVLLGAFRIGPFAALSTATWMEFGVVGLAGIACHEGYRLSTD